MTGAPARRTAARVPAESEKQFMAQVVKLAKIYHWRIYHSFDSRHSVAGFPDLFMVRGERAIAAELKRENGKISAAQTEWLIALGFAGIENYIWRPSQKQHIAEVLR